MEIIILILLIFLSALFSASEAALTSISKLRIKHLINERGEKAVNLNIWLTSPTRILTVIIIMNNVVNILASSLTTVISIKYFSHNNMEYSISIAIGILTFILLIYGEIVPKIIARTYSEEMAIKIIKPLDSLGNLLFPIVNFMIKISDFTIKALRLQPAGQKNMITEQEIKMIIDVGQKEGVVEKAEREMLHRIFRFNDIAVKSVMVPREKMICGRADMDTKDLLDLIIIKGHSRIPVYDISMDNIIGIIYDRDILLCIKENKLIKIYDCIREPLKVNENTMIDDLLHDFQSKMIHIAIVVNEEGKTAGLVTLSDLVEEIVGEIDEKFSRKII